MMNESLKKRIIIINIIAYVIVCVVVYANKKGGFKKTFVPAKKMSLGGGTPVPVSQTKTASPATTDASGKKTIPTPIVASGKTTQTIPPVARRKAPAAQIPAHIKEANELIETMKLKEMQLNYTYRATHRDPFISLLDINKFLAGSKFTPDEYAGLPPGLPTKEKQKASPFTLIGTIKSKNGESSAIINDQVLNIGDIIDGYKLTKIENKSVVLVSGKKVITLKLIEEESPQEQSISQ